jgi:hypothetical protein
MDTIKIKERTFIFKVPTPWDGCAIFNMLITYNLPFGATSVFGISSTKKPMPSEELEAFLKLCLKNCYEQLGDIKAPVVDSEGGIGIMEATSPMLTKIASQFILFFIECWQAENS